MVIGSDPVMQSIADVTLKIVVVSGALIKEMSFNLCLKSLFKSSLPMQNYFGIPRTLWANSKSGPWLSNFCQVLRIGYIHHLSKDRPLSVVS